MLEFSTVAVVNSLFWIMSLEHGEKGTTRRIHEDLLPYLASIKLPFQKFEPKSARDLLDYLDSIAAAASVGMRPIVHFDTHGTAKDGLFISASAEFVAWGDLIAKLRTINVITQNNLCVVSAACCSLNAIRPLKITEPCPFLLLVAPEREVSFGFVEDNIVSFYQKLFDGLDIMNAFNETLVPTFRLFHSERMLAVVIAKYIRDSCIGKGGELRREVLLTRALSGGHPNNRHNKRKIRKAAKTMVKPSQRLIDEYVEIFLIGKKVGFTITDLESLARSANA
jgi:hypothetical protein